MKKSFSILSDAQNYFDQMRQGVCQKYQIYYQREWSLKAKKLKWNTYIEEDVQYGQSLSDCLILHFGESQGLQLFNEFVR